MFTWMYFPLSTTSEWWPVEIVVSLSLKVLMIDSDDLADMPLLLTIFRCKWRGKTVHGLVPAYIQNYSPENSLVACDIEKT